MTLSEALYSHVSGITAVEATAEDRVYAVNAPAPVDATAEFPDVVVISFEGATITSLSTPVTRESNFTVTVVSRQHLRAAETAEAIVRDLHGYAGTMGGSSGVNIIDTEADEGPEDFDGEHLLYARSVLLKITHVF
jgi:hypothetical protein